DLGTHALDLIYLLTGTDQAAVLDQEILLDEGTDRDVRLRLAFGDVEVDVMLSWLRNLGTTLRADFDACSLITSAGPASDVRLLGADSRPQSTLTATEGAT